jgi:hypothetical protein
MEEQPRQRGVDDEPDRLTQDGVTRKRLAQLTQPIWGRQIGRHHRESAGL